MKFTVSLKDKRIRALFHFQCDYINVFVSRKVFVLFAEISDMFAMMTLNINTMQGFEEDQIFRIPKEGFFSIMQEGIISFLCESDSILVNVKNDKISHSMEFERQICSTLKLEEKLELVKKAGSYPVFDVTGLILPTKILRSMSVPITIENGVAFSSIENLQLYAKVKSSDCALFPFVLNHLISMCGGDFEHIYNVRDNIVYSDGICHVIINKVISGSACDIDYLMKQKTVFKCEADFEQALLLLSKVHNYTEVDLDLRKQELVLKTDNCRYVSRIFVKLIDIEKEQSDELTLDDIFNTVHGEIPVVGFPAGVFKNIIYAARSKSLGIACTKNLVRVSISKGLIFVCRKEVKGA